MEQFEHSIFISYTVADRDRVTPVANMLVSQGFDVWMDHLRLKPGQNWEIEIRRALDRATIILIFISDNSVNKRGYVQKELKLAIAKAEEKDFDDIFIIPILIDVGVSVPHQIKDRQYISIDDENFSSILVDAINEQFNRLGAAIAETQENTGINWKYSVLKEHADGLPGYETEIKLIKIGSSIYSNMENINDILKSDAISSVMDERRHYIDQGSELFNFGQDKYARTNSLDIRFEEPSIVGRIISIPSITYSYSAGAAHPNHYYRSHSFFLRPLFKIENLSEIFEEEAKAFSVLQPVIRAKLLEPRAYETDEGQDNFELEEEWVKKGTEDWSDIRCFIFKESGIELTFSPYQVAAYAYGHQQIVLDYETINSLLKPTYRSALNLYFFGES